MIEEASYLAGIIDGEGHVGTPSQKKIIICNTDLLLLDAVKECLDVLGITYSQRQLKSKAPHHKSCYHITISHRQNLQKIYQIVPLRTDKFKKLAMILASYERVKKIREHRQTTTADK